MTTYEIQNAGLQPDGTLLVAWSVDGALRAVSMPANTLAYRGAEYGLTDPAQILEVVLRECAVARSIPDPRDDPALAAGWVTSSDPDAEPVTLYNAVSTEEAWAAHQVRTADGGAFTVTDPDSVLSQAGAALVVDAELVRQHMEDSDTLRWTNIYGALPVIPRPIQGDTHA